MKSRLAASLALFAALAVALPAMAQPAAAQSPSAPDFRKFLVPRDIEEQRLIDFFTDYSTTVGAGVLGGGILFASVIGGVPATLVGALGGSMVGTWWLLEDRRAPVR